MANIRVALIGAGLFGPKHMGTLASEPTFKLVAIAGPTPAATDFARQCDVTASAWRKRGSACLRCSSAVPAGSWPPSAIKVSP